ncbi:glycosyltransferase family 2 protein [Fibrobacter sp. UWH9]|uniref:glycosyltransferase family 2 protein n=1 Tax=Fibrobacter sp. UWH9 TaxID=1896213 RepID=UPI001C316A7D|nr:glycosyltransferase family 2 protein [Fibrobacter sp. UWH9]
MEQGKVSVIMPAYNCERFIEATLQSLLLQTYKNWELLAVDDCSSDKTAEILERYACLDDRIKFIKNEKNLHAAMSRNKAIECAKGQYIAFLDSDDLWKSDKLEKQIAFMREQGFCFSCTAYDKIDENGKSLNRVVPAPIMLNYWGLLKHCPGNLTVMYDASVLGKHLILDIHNREDYVMWLFIIKKAKAIMGMDEVLGSHRVRRSSASSKKSILVHYHWVIYRQIEKLSILKSSYLIAYWIGKGLVSKVLSKLK